jgi:hypothetical protein
MENYLSELFVRDLIKLKEELLKFNDEANIWKVTNGITNPAGVLTKHLLGNLNHTIGAIIAKNGYVRNREYEFTIEPEPREKLIAEIEATITVVKNTLNNIDQAILDDTYPLEMIGKNTTTFYLTFFYGHFTYHLGHINYLRRILEA